MVEGWERASPLLFQCAGLAFLDYAMLARMHVRANR
jgi:hypothetical protein